MNALTAAWSRLDFSNPLVLAILGALAIVALFRRWSFVLLAVLVIALGQGLHYLLGHAALGADFNRGVVIGVYVFGGILFLFLAIAHFFTKH